VLADDHGGGDADDREHERRAQYPSSLEPHRGTGSQIPTARQTRTCSGRPKTICYSPATITRNAILRT
jgi:hypothetical protein